VNGKTLDQQSQENTSCPSQQSKSRFGSRLKGNNQNRLEYDRAPMLGSFVKGVIMRQTLSNQLTPNRDGFGAAQDDSFSVSLARV
jgi:hypothetical protein